MATISSLGTGSGLDLNALLTNLMSAEQAPLVALKKIEASYQARISSFGTVQSSLSSLQSATNFMVPGVGITASSKFSIPQAAVADTTIASATAEATAATSSYSLEVSSLAKAQRLVTPAYGVGSSASTVIGTGKLKIEFGTLSTDLANYTADNDTDSTPTVNRTKTITIDSTNNTLGGLRDSINASGADVTASIVVGTGGAQLVLTGKQTGLSSIMKMTMTDFVAPAVNPSYVGPPATDPRLVAIDRNPISGGSGMLSDTAAGGQVASNAAFTINGIAGSSTSNTVTGMIEGVTLNLSKTTAVATPTTITVSKDNSTNLTSGLTTFVKAYNDATQTMATLGAFDLVTKKAGALQGNSALLNAQSQVRNQLFNVTAGGSSPYQRLSDIGISLGKDGKLSLDASKLNAAIAADYTSVANLVSTVGKAYQTTLTGLVGITGSIPSAVSGTSSLITDNKANQTRLSARLTAIESRYRKQFTALDSVVASMKSTSTYLTQQLANLPGFTTSSK
jgi:flagellar hook-associated protein 2